MCRQPGYRGYALGRKGRARREFPIPSAAMTMPAVLADTAGIVFVCEAQGRLVDPALQPFAGLELRLVRGGDMDPFTGSRVAAHSGLPVRHAECPETHKANFLAALQRAANRIEYSIDGLGGIGFRQSGAARYGSNKIILVQLLPPSPVSE